MKRFIYFTEQGYCEAPNGKQVENFQVLGIENGETEDEARKALLANNSWIVENGFRQEKIWCRELK